MKSEFLTDLVISPLKNHDDIWVVKEVLIYNSHIFKGTIRIPSGFVTDLASVPRVPIFYDAFGGRANVEAVLHDYLYQHHLTSKGRADRIFLEAMKVCKKPLWIRWGMYLGVTAGGWTSYASGPDRFKVLQKKA